MKLTASITEKTISLEEKYSIQEDFSNQSFIKVHQSFYLGYDNNPLEAMSFSASKLSPPDLMMRIHFYCTSFNEFVHC